MIAGNAMKRSELAKPGIEKGGKIQASNAVKGTSQGKRETRQKKKEPEKEIQGQTERQAATYSQNVIELA